MDQHTAATGQHTATLAAIGTATGRLLATIAALTDGQAGEPSLLPGWTRGHVLTHLARNADGMARLLHAARSGTEAAMYASDAARDADIEAGAGRPAAELAADVRESAAGFAREAGLMPAGAWTAVMRRIPGGEHFPVATAPLRRQGEVEIHHADLGLGYRPQDWPEEFATAYLPRVAGTWAGRADAPACLLCPAGTGDLLPVGAAQPGDAVPAVHGSPADMLAWLTGRSPGDGLAVQGAGPLPALPKWR